MLTQTIELWIPAIRGLKTCYWTIKLRMFGEDRNMMTFHVN